MEILSVEKSTSDKGGLNVKLKLSTREINYHLFDGVQTPMANRIRKALMSYNGEIKPASELSEKEIEVARKNIRQKQIDAVNADLKELGSRQIKSYEEIKNARAYIQLKRAEVFEQNEGA